MADLTLHVPLKTSVNTLLALTAEQEQTMAEKVAAYNGGDRTVVLREVELWLESWGLPTGWVAIRFLFSDGGKLDGGLPPEGGMHT